MTYQLIRQPNFPDFNIAVNNFLKDGWNLRGDTLIQKEGDVLYFYQVMVK